MKTLAARSLLIFALSVILLAAFTFSETSLGAMPAATQRGIAFLGLILPAGVGCVLGAISLVRKEGRAWLAVTGIALNGLFAVFHLLIVLFAG